VEEAGSESWEDGVGEEIDVEDWREELGGGQMEPVRSQVREESSGEGSGGVLNSEGWGGCCCQKGFEQRYRIEAGRVESREKEKLGCMEFWTTCHCGGRNCQDLEVCENQKYHFQPIVIDCLACTEAKWCCSNRSFA
jgi:hypothetical protein